MTHHKQHDYSPVSHGMASLKPHDHLCLIYESREEWLETIVPFILTGLKRGEKCIYVVDVNTVVEIKTIFQEAGLAVDEYESKGQFSVIHERDSYTQKGFFDPDLMIATLQSETEKALQEGYSALRVTGEMSWVLRHYSGKEKILEYEAKLNQDLFPTYPCVALCQYDRWKFDPEIIKGVVLTHPLLIRGGQIYRNFYYIEPDEYLSFKTGEREVQHWLNNLERERMTLEKLQKSEEKHRRLFETMAQGVIYQGKDGTIISANPAAEKILGLSLQDLQGKTSMDPHWQMIKEDGSPVPGTQHPAMMALRTGKKVGPVVRGVFHPEKDTHIWLNLIAIPLFRPGEEDPFQAYATFEDITDQKQMERELTRSEALLYASQKIAHIGGWEYDVSSKTITWTDEVYHIHGVSKDYDPSNIQENFTFYPPHARKIIAEAFLRSLHEGEAYDLEVEFVNAQGDPLWVRTAGYPEQVNGKIIRIIGNIMDITKQKEKEELLQEKEAFIKTILDHLPIGIAVNSVDPSVEFDYINDTFIKIYRTTKEELAIPDQFWEAIYKDEVFREEIRQRVLDDCASGDRNRMCWEDIPVKGEGEETFYITAMNIPLPDRSKVISTVVDVTKQKRIEEELRKSEEKYRLLSENASDMIWTTDLNLLYTYVSPTVEKLLGYTVDELLKVPAQDLFPIETLALIKTILKEELEREQQGVNDLDRSRTLEYKQVCKDGSRIWVESRASFLRDKEGKPTGLIGITRDINERKQMEEKIQYQHDFQKVVANISYTFLSTPPSQMDEAINNALYQIGTFFHVDRAYMVQFSPDIQFFSNTHEWCREGIKPQKERFQDHTVADFSWSIKEILSKEYLLIPDVRTVQFKEEREEFQRQGIQSLLCIPIKIQERVIGLIGMDTVRKKMIWTEEEITLLKVISEIISSSFSRHQVQQELIQRNQEVEHLNRHLNQEIEKAHRIHNHILPKELPAIQGISFAAFYQPAETLGGDFYAVVPAGNKLVIYLSDISGHGLDGGMINFFVKEAIASYITLQPEKLNPRSILQHLEQQFRQESYPEELFICIFLAVLDLETMELTYAGAGFQDTPLVWQGNGEQEKLSTNGLFINSVFSIHKNNRPEKTITLTRGSTIFFNTDGLTEQGEAGAFYRDRLPQVFYENAYLPPDGISQAVMEDFRSFNNGSLQGYDDITFLILQVDPENSRQQLELATDFGELEPLRYQAIEFLPDIEEKEVFISCLYELTANAMEHGNKMDPTKKVMVEMVLSQDYMRMSVEDEGKGFNWRDKIDKLLDLEGYTERGRGIPMTRILSNTLYYNDEGNRVTCMVGYGKGAPASR